MNRQYTCLMGLVLLLLAVGCAGPQNDAYRPRWPAAPEPPLISFDRVIYGSSSLERGFWGGFKDFLFGEAPEQSLVKPYGMAWDGESILYVADTGHKALLMMNLDSGRVSRLRNLGHGLEFVEPVQVMISKSGHIHVADTGLGYIIVLDSEGMLVRKLGEGILTSPVGMAEDFVTGEVFVADTQQHCIVVLDADGKLVRRIGKRGDEKGQFYHPLSVALAKDGRIYVVDSLHFAVQVLDREGKYLTSFGHARGRMGDLARPRDVVIQGDRRLFITDAMNNNIRVYDLNGVLQLTFGGYGTGNGEFRLPAGATLIDDDQLLVADSINHRIQFFTIHEHQGGS